MKDRAWILLKRLLEKEFFVIRRRSGRGDGCIVARGCDQAVLGERRGCSEFREGG
jgi:hypothetical protein